MTPADPEEAFAVHHQETYMRTSHGSALGPRNQERPMTDPRRHRRYDLFDTLKGATALQVARDADGELAYHKMVQTGELSLHDYGVGFLNFETEMYYQVAAGTWHVRIWIATVDDGDFGGWSAAMPKIKSHMAVYLIAQDVMKDMVRFPSDQKLNEMLRRYGVSVGPE